jgi:hypothetical protein
MVASSLMRLVRSGEMDSELSTKYSNSDSSESRWSWVSRAPGSLIMRPARATHACCSSAVSHWASPATASLDRSGACMATAYDAVRTACPRLTSCLK